MRRRLALAMFMLTYCTLPMAAQVGRNCTVTSTTVAFGHYTGAIANVTGTITVTCGAGRAYDVGLSAGTSTGASCTGEETSTQRR